MSVPDQRKRPGNVACESRRVKPPDRETSAMLQELVSDLSLVIKTMMVMAEEFGLDPPRAKTLVTATLNLVDRASYNTLMFMALDAGLKPDQARALLGA